MARIDDEREGLLPGRRPGGGIPAVDRNRRRRQRRAESVFAGRAQPQPQHDAGGAARHVEPWQDRLGKLKHDAIASVARKPIPCGNDRQPARHGRIGAARTVSSRSRTIRRGASRIVSALPGFSVISMDSIAWSAVPDQVMPVTTDVALADAGNHIRHARTRNRRDQNFAIVAAWHFHGLVSCFWRKRAVKAKVETLGQACRPCREPTEAPEQLRRVCRLRSRHNDRGSRNKSIPPGLRGGASIRRGQADMTADAPTFVGRRQATSC